MAMNMMRSQSSLNIAAPPPSPTPSAPPSPIPRAAGSRSAANQILAEFLEKSLQVPELALREPHSQRVPEEINLRSLVLGENYWLDRVMKSAREFGAFRIRCHGISAEELRALVRETERVFGILEERDTGYRRDIGRRNDNKEEIVWVRSGKERMEWAREYIGPELFRSFSEKVEDVASKLDAIAQLLGQVFVQQLGRQLGKMCQEQSVLSIYRYNHNNIMSEQSPSPSERHHNHSCNQVLSLHLPFRQCKYWVETTQSPFSFNAGPDVIVVTVGKQLEEWSMGEFKSVYGEMIHPPDLKASYSLELKCSSLNLKQSFSKTQKKISIVDQILIGLVIAVLYHIFKFLWS
ncbi:hypothetical protein CUMW_001220 [Citrus unshiu]|nr:hypothetical protein CUMW_001220 [Citrus unshiu]